MAKVVHFISEDNYLLGYCATTKIIWALFQIRKNQISSLNIRLLKKKLGEKTCYVLPFLHGISGCDAIYRLFGIGRSSVIKKANNDKSFLNQAHTFCSTQRFGLFYMVEDTVIHKYQIW